MTEIKNIIFDVGEVLIGYHWEEMLDSQGLDEQTKLRIGQEVFSDPEKVWHRFDLGLLKKEEVINLLCEEFPEDADIITWAVTHSELMPKARPMVWDRVHELKEKGYGIYILSNYPEELFQQHIGGERVLADMDGIVVSSRYHVGKPERRIYEILCEEYGLKPEECIFFDDRKENVEAAIGFGMQSVQVVSEEGLLADLSAL